MASWLRRRVYTEMQAEQWRKERRGLAQRGSLEQGSQLRTALNSFEKTKAMDVPKAASSEKGTLGISRAAALASQASLVSGSAYSFSGGDDRWTKAASMSPFSSSSYPIAVAADGGRGSKEFTHLELESSLARSGSFSDEEVMGPESPSVGERLVWWMMFPPGGN